MEHERVIHGLQRKRAEIAGRLEVAHAEISRLAVDLAAIDATIRMFAPHAELDEISPRKPQAPGAAKPGKISRIVLAALRDAPGAVSTRDVTLAVMSARGMPAADIRLFEPMQKRVLACLRNLRIRGCGGGAEGTGKAYGVGGLWPDLNNPQMRGSHWLLLLGYDGNALILRNPRFSISTRREAVCLLNEATKASYPDFVNVSVLKNLVCRVGHKRLPLAS